MENARNLFKQIEPPLRNERQSVSGKPDAVQGAQDAITGVDPYAFLSMGNHRVIKRTVAPMIGFKAFYSVAASIAGI